MTPESVVLFVGSDGVVLRELKGMGFISRGQFSSVVPIL